MHGDSHSNTHSAPEGSHGPHNSRVANAADPRVDSDRDGSNTMGNRRTAGHGETGSNPFTSSGTHNNTLGSTGTHNAFGSSGTAEGTHGPHSSRLANAADPRVDSDRDGSNTMGGRSTGTHGIGGTTGGFGTGLHTADNTFGTGSHQAGSGVTGMTGTHGAPAGTHGPHSSRMANVADPRVDSDRDGRAAIGTGPGPAPNTAGPHKSDMMNKADPRIDSDLDGSKTFGGNKTYQSSSASGLGRRDPTDAAQVPPSVLKQHLGDPVVEHGDHTHQRERRNSVKTDQEMFRGL
ncbi:hypothetical protein B0T16DRAFT_338785 [Cercophora newfieldiana]|uniref:Uncharacterized protein n=1 Tax=Cercophora newfieldiana TaxID=92897 RepID=A0AA39XT49_9PEZI|nr:hypothetical protein B0T16DRAFT_338785 [Cercophora newfieldiana]